jgi:uncharacterized protein (UPF0332 family)
MPSLLFWSAIAYRLLNMQVCADFFNRHYVKTGKVPKELARIYNDLFERRQESDYIDFVSFQQSQVLPWISEAEELVEYITILANKEIS